MKVLSTKEFEHIITWMPSGNSFSIVEPKAFVADILPDHFKSAKYASFTRKLHRWGFMRHYRGEEAGGFYHKLFKKDRRDLVEQMTCHKVELQAPRAVHKAAKSTAVAPRPVKTRTDQKMANVPRVQQLLSVPPTIDMAAQLQNRLSLSSLQDSQIGAAERLNAAIELEVARRIKERIQAAAVSRTTFAFMNPFNHQQIPVSANLPWNAMGGGFQAQLHQMQQQKNQLGLAAHFAPEPLKQPRDLGEQFASHVESKGLEKAPHMNIRSAKTA